MLLSSPSTNPHAPVIVEVFFPYLPSSSFETLRHRCLQPNFHGVCSPISILFLASNIRGCRRKGVVPVSCCAFVLLLGDISEWSVSLSTYQRRGYQQPRGEIYGFYVDGRMIVLTMLPVRSLV
ncbi:hypothetical protein KSP39_PZI011093 [Platanthera zijinensis]|uniref:Uncharacterized protein n=1 Tax=Platanthera zijinensis TaxID=2320716 RepID=A0AAP0BHQ0_9ASPA